MYSDMSMRISAVSSSNRYSASALVSSVLPTPVGPRNMNEPIGRLGSCRPARARRTAVETAFTASAWPIDALGELLLHLEQLLLLALEHLVDRHAGPARHHLGDVIGGDRLLHHRALIRIRLDPGELLLELGDTAIGQFARALVFAAALRVGELDPQLVELGLQLLRVGELALLGIPARGQVGRTLLELLQLLLEVLQARLRARIGFLLQRLLLDAQPHDLAVDRVELFRLGIDLHLQPRRRLVDQVDRLVGQEAVGDVAVRQRRRRPPARCR